MILKYQMTKAIVSYQRQELLSLDKYHFKVHVLERIVNHPGTTCHPMLRVEYRNEIMTT